jgi:nitronate monooxygenase
MNFGSGGNQDAKAWRDIWGSGQGVGAIDTVLSAGELVAKFAEQYEDAKAELAAKTALTSGNHLAFAAQ